MLLTVFRCKNFIILKRIKTVAFVLVLLVSDIRVDSYESRDFIADVGIVYGNKVEHNGLPSARLEVRSQAAFQ
ncbi:hypothetical protein EA58_11570 [Photobacterium galatheae]|uniref:Uncharacterized protein n=1 Tax=Photobacterium galatheae TaxID=1654360 RepID=A0A066RMJ7_9GAMM|nr:hypothetical protein EA58_11570 [Photobacterium galatheae]